MFVLRNSSWKSCSFDPLSNTDHSAKENCIPINWSKEDQWCFEPCYGILHDATVSTNCVQVSNGCAQARLPWHMRHAFCKFVNHFAGSTALEKPYYRWLETVFHSDVHCVQWTQSWPYARECGSCLWNLVHAVPGSLQQKLSCMFEWENPGYFVLRLVTLSLIHIWRCRRS